MSSVKEGPKLGAALDKESADASWAVELVGAEGEGGYAQVVEVDGNLAGRLGCVAVKANAGTG